MKIIYWVIKLLILSILLFFSIQNTHIVSFTWLPTQSVNLPLIVLLLVAFIVGALVGIFSMLGRILSLRAENTSFKKKLKKAEKDIENMETSTSKEKTSDKISSNNNQAA